MADLLEHRLTRCPLPFDKGAADDSAARFADIPPPLRDLLAGTAGCSPYLRGLMHTEGAWLRAAMARSLEDLLPGLRADLAQADALNPGTALRQAKARLALLAGLADLSGAWDVLEVTQALSDFADLAVQTALQAALLPLLRRGKIPGKGEADAQTGAGMVVLAMGKMGAGELNYSSDIDLICLFDETQFDPSDVMEARAAFIKATRTMAKTLSDRTAAGYVFRTDLRLRPDASVTPVCMAMDAAERYYESVGRTWERAAYIKARPCAGDLAAGQGFLDRLRPFVWRRHLDFAAIEDAHDMRRRIRDHKNLHETGEGDGLEGRDLKLAAGGIREIEFFTQTRQIIAGGRDPSLRNRRTLEALQALVQAGWVPEVDAARLAEDYVAHRRIEHRIQMVHDAHTHRLPTDADGFDRLARLCAMADTSAFRADLKARVTRVHGIVERFYEPAQAAAPEALQAADRFTIPAEIIDRWRRYPALRTDRAQRIFERLRPDLEHRLGDSPRPEQALAALDGFLSGLPAGVQLFSMFQANPALRALIVEIAATAPALARYLSSNARVLDAVIGGDFFSDWPGLPALEQALAERLQAAPDYEARLDVARRWQKEWHFRIGVHLLRGLITADTAGQHYAQLAEATLSALLPVVAEALAQRHGPAPGKGAAVLGMGSLGAGWLTSHSDLDLIVIFDADGQDSSDGPRPLAARAWYARLTQMLVTALSAPTAEGRLYEVDMRLRPSGRQGPVATSLQAFARYQREDAWVWEHLALTRGRVLAGPADLRASIAQERSTVLARPRAPGEIWRETAQMRARIAEAKGRSGLWEAKLGPGRMQDIELFAQACALQAVAEGAPCPGAAVADHLEAGASLGLDTEPLRAAYGPLRTARALLLLTCDEGQENSAPGAGAGAVLAQALDADSAESVAQDLAKRAEAADKFISDTLQQRGAE